MTTYLHYLPMIMITMYLLIIISICKMKLVRSNANPNTAIKVENLGSI